MKKFDIIVIGSGCGAIVAEEAASHGLKVALVDRGPVGGTCLNNGCIPSKMLIYAADRIVEAQEAKKLGIRAEVKSVDFGFIMERMRHSIHETHSGIKENLSQSKNPQFYGAEAHFVDEYTLEVNNEKIRGDKIVIASGSRPFIPPIKGLDGVDYLTNVTLLQLKEKPGSIIIIGGGYISVEYGHFFAAIGARVTIIEMADRLVLAEEPEISEMLKKRLMERMDVYTGALAEEIKRTEKGVAVTVSISGKKKEFTVQKILMAVGRRSNADTLKVENTGVETDKKGYIKVNEHMETSKKNIFAVGDADGQQMFTHVGNREAMLVGHNILHNASLKMDYSAAPHAVYSYPQIAAVGMLEKEARENHDVMVGIAQYSSIAKGEAMMEEEGFAKAIVDKESEKILGFHIIGPYAPELIQEVTNAMTSGGHINQINNGMHIHPALSELIPVTFSRLE